MTQNNKDMPDAIYLGAERCENDIAVWFDYAADRIVSDLEVGEMTKYIRADQAPAPKAAEDEDSDILKDLRRLSAFARSTDDNIPFHHIGTINMLTARIERALTPTPPNAALDKEAIFAQFEKHWHYTMCLGHAWDLVCRDLASGGQLNQTTKEHMEEAILLVRNKFSPDVLKFLIDIKAALRNTTKE